MAFILPVTVFTMFLGSTFDLRGYNFLSGIVYDVDAISPFTQITEINSLTAEYRLIETQVDLREFLGIDVATGLKALVGQYPYNYETQLKNVISSSMADEVHVALKINLRTVNETIPYGTPEVSNWESDIGWRNGTHFVKSVIYGSNVFFIFNIPTINSQHKTAIKEALLSALGRSGTLDASFKEKFSAVLQENRVGYFYSAFGSVPLFADNVPPKNVDDMLALKSNLVDIMKSVNNGKGATLFYEMQPLSQLSSTVPLLEISGEIFQKLKDVELKFEDLRFAYDEYRRWISNTYVDFSQDDEIMIEEFQDELYTAYDDMLNAISTMDISTAGSIDQFSKAMISYGNTNDTQRYRKKLELLRQQFPEE